MPGKEHLLRIFRRRDPATVEHLREDIEELDERMDSIERKLDRIGAVLNILSAQVDHIEKRLAQ